MNNTEKSSGSMNWYSFFLLKQGHRQTRIPPVPNSQSSGTKGLLQTCFPCVLVEHGKPSACTQTQLWSRRREMQTILFLLLHRGYEHLHRGMSLNDTEGRSGYYLMHNTADIFYTYYSAGDWVEQALSHE